MALEYSLNLDGAFLADKLIAALSEAGFTPAGGASDTLLAEGVTATVGGASDRFNRYADAFGFSPSSAVLFSVDQRDEYEAGMAAMLTGVSAILAALPDDAVLVGNHDTGLLLRREQDLVLTSRDNWWTDGMTPPPIGWLDATPHRFATLPIF